MTFRPEYGARRARERVEVTPVCEDDLVRLPLYDAITACRACGIRAEAKRPLPPEGSQSSPVLVIGQNPGREEEEAGRLFVGPTGVELGGWLRVLQIDRRRVAVMNVVACHTEKNRTPRVGEARGCATRWIPETLAVMPHLAVILLLGRPAQAAVLPKFRVPLLEMVAVRAEFADRQFWIYPLVHPAYILRSQDERPRLHGVLREVRDHWVRTLPEVYRAVQVGGGGSR